MAESKRNSVAGKIATPKTAGPLASAQPAQPLVDTMEALGKSIGARIKLTTVAPHSQPYEGTLFTACPILNVIAINTRPPTMASNDPSKEPGDYHIIPVSKVQSVQVLSLNGTSDSNEEAFKEAQPAIGPVDTKHLKERERAKIKKLNEEDLNQGKGVTKEGQALFDSFKRINVPIWWHGKDMIVHEAVIISPPYRPEDCRAKSEDQNALNRVKKVLEGERNKLKQKEEQARKAATPVVGPRKGG